VDWLTEEFDPMRLTRMAARVFGVVAVAVGCLGVATEAKAGVFGGGRYGGGYYNGGRYNNGFRPGYRFGGGYRPGYGYGGYRPGYGYGGGGFYPGGSYNGGFSSNRPGYGRPQIFIPR
jgi:hypothetical protein